MSSVAVHPVVAVPTDLRTLSLLQAGVVTRPQLQRLGYRQHDVATAVAARRWQTFGRRVVVLHNASLSLEQQRWVASLMPRQPSALAGLTAAACAGLQGFDDTLIHVVVAGTCDTRVPDWVKVHNSRRFHPSDIHAGDPRPRTPIARALIDAAAWSRSARRACAILCAGVQQRLVVPRLLGDELRRAGRVRHVRLMRDILGDIDGGGHTLAEIELGPLARLAGLPTPRRQVLRRQPRGRVRYVDAEFELPDRTILTVEIDGAVHLKPLQWWDDMVRQNELTIAGSPVLRFDSVTVRLNPERVVDQLRRMRLMHS